MIGHVRSGQAKGVENANGQITFSFEGFKILTSRAAIAGRRADPTWAALASTSPSGRSDEEATYRPTGDFTGEACIRGNLSHGDGVYKSTDAGKTWSHIGLRDTQHVVAGLDSQARPTRS